MTTDARLDQVDHRPWPLPGGPWVLAQQWHDLLFAHWPLPAAALRTLIPPSLRLDTWQGEAWISVVPFVMRGVRPRIAPAVPWLSAFPELNVRTYVTGPDGNKPGVYFFSLDAANPLAVRIARRFFRLPYFDARMQVRNEGESVLFQSQRTHRAAAPGSFVARYAPTGPIEQAKPATLDHWLAERYCFYTIDKSGHPLICEIHHAPWPLQPATVEFAQNDIAGASALGLAAAPTLLHFARRLDVVAWPLQRYPPQTVGAQSNSTLV
jgi:uncharacterized protein YqjF (DUF2071 family)